MTTAGPDQEKMWEVYAAPERAEGEPALVVDVDGFEGPLDLLLALARAEKVDITRISILALAEQYLAFIERVRVLKLEIAADYLVMAAWLAYLKSRLLLPEAPGDEGPTGEELAADLAFRLRRLGAMREAAARLANRNRLGRDVFARGAPEPIAVKRVHQYEATLYDLLAAYAVRRQERATSVVRVRARPVWSLKDAHAALGRLIGHIPDWIPLRDLLSPYFAASELRRSVAASSFGASLELVRGGTIELRQTEAFAPLYIRDRAGDPPVAVARSEPDHG
jgi:segregation and condensation protein A